MLGGLCYDLISVCTMLRDGLTNILRIITVDLSCIVNSKSVSNEAAAVAQIPLHILYTMGSYYKCLCREETNFNYVDSNLYLSFAFWLK